MTRMRRKRWRRLATAAFVAAGATATVALAQSAGGGATVAAVAVAPAEAPAVFCTRFASLSLAAAEGIRQGRVEQVANGRMTVVGTRKGVAVKLTLENGPDSCRLVKVDML